MYGEHTPRTGTSHDLRPSLDCLSHFLTREGPRRSALPSLCLLSCLSAGSISLKDKFQAQLDGPVTAGAQHGVEGSVVRSGAAAAEGTGLRRIGICALTIAAGGAIGVSVVRVIKNIEGLDAELCSEAFAEFEILADGKVDVVETRVTEHISTQGAKRAQPVRNQDGIAVRVATRESEGCREPWNSASIESRSLRSAG